MDPESAIYEASNLAYKTGKPAHIAECYGELIVTQTIYSASNYRILETINPEIFNDEIS